MEQRQVGKTKRGKATPILFPWPSQQVGDEEENCIVS
jgi:hypothetical protein